MKRPVAGTTAALTVKRPRTSARPGNPQRTDGRSSRWAEHRTARRTELVDPAIAAVRQYGAGVGMDQIASVAETSKPVIYRYFADKADVYRAVAERVAGELVDRLAEVVGNTISDPRATLAAGVDAHLTVLEDSPELYRFVVNHPFVATGGDDDGAKTGTDYPAMVSVLITRQVGRFMAASGLDPALARPWGASIVGFVRAASDWWVDNRDVMSRAQLTEYLTSLIWGGAAGLYNSVGIDVDNRPPAGVFPRLEQE